MRSRMPWCATACRRRPLPSSAWAKRAFWSRPATACASRRTAASRSSSSKTIQIQDFAGRPGSARPFPFVAQFVARSRLPDRPLFGLAGPGAASISGRGEFEFMSQVLMPKATAVWLVENTTLTFDQISAFTGLHPLEVQAIADGEVAGGMTGLDPTTNGQLTKEEIKRAEGDPTARLKLSPRDVPEPVARSKGPRYTPVAKRQDRPDAIAWLLKVHPELQDSQVAKLVGSTKSTVQSVRDRTHWNMQNVRPRDPVTLGLCSLRDLNEAVDKARRKAARDDAARKKASATTGAGEEAAEADERI